MNNFYTSLKDMKDSLLPEIHEIVFTYFEYFNNYFSVELAVADILTEEFQNKWFEDIRLSMDSFNANEYNLNIEKLYDFMAISRVMKLWSKF